MSTNADIVSASEEWAYSYVKDQYANSVFPAAIPCQFRFLNSPQQDVHRFHTCLWENDYIAVDDQPTKDDYAIYYDGEIASNDHYNRVRVLVFRESLIRLYPHDDYVPTADELQTIVDCIESGWHSPVEHYPIERQEKQ